jgi:hypothetical protein
LSGLATNRDLAKNCDKTRSMANALKAQNATRLSAIFRILFFLAVAGGAGCTTLCVRSNFVPSPNNVAPRTVQVSASSSIEGRPMGEDSTLREKLAKAFQKQFPTARMVESGSDMFVILTIVDYVPGCSPDCKKFRPYRNWTCEVISYPRESSPEAKTMVINIDGSSYNCRK